MSFPAEPELTNTERLAVTRAEEQFNRGLYFECHDTLEDLWLGLRGPARDFFQGLIQVSVGHHHLGRGNPTGARRTFARALGRFEAYPGRYLGFNLDSERTRLRALVAALPGEGIASPHPPPVWRFEGLPGAKPDRAP